MKETNSSCFLFFPTSPHFNPKMVFESPRAHFWPQFGRQIPFDSFLEFKLFFESFKNKHSFQISQYCQNQHGKSFGKKRMEYSKQTRGPGFDRKHCNDYSSSFTRLVSFLEIKFEIIL